MKGRLRKRGRAAGLALSIFWAAAPGAASPEKALDAAATRAAYERGDCGAALSGLEAEADANAQDPLAQYRLGFCLERLGQAERAREVKKRSMPLFERRGAQGNDWEPFYYLSAISALDLQDAEAARKHAEEGLKRLPHAEKLSAVDCFKASRLAGFARRDEESAAWMRRAAERFAADPSPPVAYAAEALRRSGEAALEAGENARAREWLERAVALDPGLLHTWYLVGVVRLRLDDRSGAREAFSRFDREPERTEAQYAVRVLDKMSELRKLPATLPDGRRVADVQGEDLRTALRSACGGEWNESSRPAALALLAEHLRRGQLLREMALSAGCIDLLFR